MKVEWTSLPNAPQIIRILNWGAARDDARDDAWDAVRDAAWGAVLALVAWDDCGVLLDMPVDAIKTLAALEHHPAVLLLPICIAMENDI